VRRRQLTETVIWGEPLKAVAGASVKVVNRADGSDAQVFDVESGGTDLGPTVTTDLYGRIDPPRFVDPGEYTLQVSGGTPPVAPFDVELEAVSFDWVNEVVAAVSAAAVQRSLVNAKGDLLAGTADDTLARVAVGADGRRIVADSAQTPGFKWMVPYFVSVKDPPYNAVGDGVADDTAAIQAAFDALGVNGGTVYFPAGDYICGSSLNLDDRRSIILRGTGGLSAGAQTATRLKFTGTGSGRFLSCRSSYGIAVLDMWVGYSSGSFTGNLIDFSHSATGGDGAYSSIERCVIGGTASSTRSAVGVFVNKSQSGTVRDCFVLNCDVGIKGKDVNASYCAGWKILGCTFNTNTSSPIRNGGNAWSIRGCVFEPLANGNACAYDHDTDVGTNGLSFEDNWTGDVTSGLGTWVTYAGTGLNVKGNEFQAGVTGVHVDNWSTFFSEGIVVRGNRFSGLTTAVTLDAGVIKYKIGPNAYSSVTNRALANGVLIIEDGADYGTVASAATITPTAFVTQVTGTTTITSVTAAVAGTRITLIFSGALTFTDGSNLKLNGNFVTTADDTITLVSDGANWIETGRSVN
jgi:hypothetical protein